MIYGNIDFPDTYQHLLSHPVWAQAFQWLKDMPDDIKPGIYPIRDQMMYVIVQQYDTLRRDQCRFENHRKYLDLQYTFRGGELIEMKGAPELKPDGEYDAGKEVQFYQLAETKTVLHMLPRCYAIFHFYDAHLPKVSDGIHKSVGKLVIKIHRDLLEVT
jgi:YhcH/YjgK/YiaL family protein